MPNSSLFRSSTLVVTFAAVASVSSAAAFTPRAFVPKTILCPHPHPKTCLWSTTAEPSATNAKGAEQVADIDKLQEKLTDNFESTPKPSSGSQKLYEVFPGFQLPEDEAPPPVLDNQFTVKKVIEYLGSAQGLAGELLLRPKTSTSLDVAQNLIKEVNNLPANIPKPDDYKFFGNNDHSKALVQLLKTNPFMASALTETRSGFKLTSYDPDEEKPSLYLEILRTLNGAGHRVNFKFDKKMRITKFNVYDDVDGSKKSRGGLDLDTYASSAIYNLFFYASCIHATIHVLHYFLTAAFQTASKDYKEMNQWASDYAKNVARKYEQVGILLINDPLPTKDFPDGRGPLSLITGVAGFGSSQAIRPILAELLNMWCREPTAEAFVKNMFHLSDKRMEKAGILEEFNKHVALVKPFGDDAAKALRKLNPEKYTAAEIRLKDYLKGCGKLESNIETLDTWLELMSITGQMHGGTLSFTRALGKPEIARWRNIVNPLWDVADVNLITGGLGTIVGMQSGRHVMTDEPKTYVEELQSVLDQYNSVTTALKTKYKKKLLNDKDFDEYGWILSDYAPDDFDGKQLTIATYI